MDSHADTCCAGENMRVLSFLVTGERVNVSPFLETYKALLLTDIPIASVAMVWECPKTATGKLLVDLT
jgi:hypothetical protein